MSGFSEVYTSWGGGEGQIALHGTNAPGLLGQAASNGCVRLENTVFLQVQELAPTGTPVQIVP
jgi:lipoprotein-anchoring transpeptidase ErfK/SrfK